MANSPLRPPQANNDAPSRVAPVVVSGLGVVTTSLRSLLLLAIYGVFRFFLLLLFPFLL